MNERPAEPERTWAIVAGVEKYAAGKSWDLKGPLNDACRFVRWLRSRNVPAEQIKLLLSPLDQDQQEAADQLTLDPDVGVRWEMATANAIYAALNEFHMRVGDLLYLFLGGHGVMIDGDRLLLTADATANEFYNIDFDDLLKSLKTDYFSGFQQQVLIVDTCAEYVSLTDLPYKPEKRGLSKGHHPHSPDQFVLYAAADGERAANDPIERTGHFSHVVLDWLHKSDHRRWPPNLDELVGYVKDHFSRQARESDSQTPIVIRWKGWKGDEDDLHGSINFFTKRMRLIREVREQLNSFEIDGDQWFGFYLQTCRYLDREPPNTRSRDLMVRYLAAATAFDREGREFPEPIYEFVWRAAQGIPDHKLQDWAESQIDNKTKLANLKNRHAKETLSPISYVMIELAITGSENHPFTKAFRWGLWCGFQNRVLDYGECETNGTLPGTQAALSELINHLRTKRPKDRFHIEFFVSREHLSIHFDQWKFRGSPLGRNFPVTVRSGDLVAVEDREFYVGKIHVNALFRNPSIQWLPHRDYGVEDISPHFMHPERCCAIFGFASPVSGNDELRQVIETLLDCGAPFMLWAREQVGGQFKRRLNQTAAAGSLDGFPLRVYQLRAENKVALATLYWDDPVRSSPGLFDPA